MSLSRIIILTLKKEKLAIILYIFTCLFNILYFNLLYGVKNILYPIELTLFFLTIYLICKGMKYRKFYKWLEESRISPSYKIDKDSEFNYIFNVIHDIHSSYVSKIYSLKSKEEDKDKLLVEWIHNMKTSVAIISLALEKGVTENLIEDIREENVLLQKNLEGALNIFRLDKFSKDYVPEKLNLREIVKDSINSEKRNFIYSNVFPVVDISDEFNILSDKKWSGFVLDQVISNAIKYSKEGSKVYFKAEEFKGKINLYIKDHGVGIKKEEITRVFQPFYTGSNGRRCKKSTGVGLYMCKNICQSLNENIEIESEEGKYTKVTISYLKSE
ncbi:MAG: HAMP domain-containing histidine kinase [Clostridium sp.]|nr:HAMP domain-containing histidine kinase [Clostridium sp.]